MDPSVLVVIGLLVLAALLVWFFGRFESSSS
jgi:hypothetical protein